MTDAAQWYLLILQNQADVYWSASNRADFCYGLESHLQMLRIVGIYFDSLAEGGGTHSLAPRTIRQYIKHSTQLYDHS